MDDQDADLRALRREWLAARIVFAGGFGLALIAAIVFAIWRPVAPTAATSLAAPPSERQHMAEMFCTSALGVAQAFGIVPGFAKPEGVPQRTDVKGRYTCAASTSASKYAITVDLMCTDLGDSRCFNLYSVSQDDGTVLFQRQT